MEWCGYEWESCMDGGRIIHTGQPWMWYCGDNAKVDPDGTMRLSIDYRPIYVERKNGKIYNPTMAVGIVRTKTAFSYGTFSSKIKMPKGCNLWPSFWLSGDKNWPPEIDIAEAWSGNGDYFDWFVSGPPYLYPSWRTTTNVHYNNVVDSGGMYVDGTYEKTSIGSKNIPWCKQMKDPSENFIEYKCEWFPDSIKFYVDGKLVRRVGKKISKDLVGNLPDERYQMDVIFDLWCENPDEVPVSIDSDMLVRDFKYTSYIK